MSATQATDTITRPCGKCLGRGTIRAFSHVAAGQCFACLGRGHFVTTVAQENRRKAAAARREAKRVASEAARVEAYVAGRFAQFKAWGLTLDEAHDEHCGCRVHGVIRETCTVKTAISAAWGE